MKGSQSWPSIAVITPGRCTPEHLTARAELLYQVGMRMLVLREPQLSPSDQQTLVKELGQRCPELCLVHHLKCPGTRSLLVKEELCVHLPAAVNPRELSGLGTFGVSVHDQAELAGAIQAGASYAMLAPVWAPNSKPGDRRPTLGPQGYEGLLATSSIALYALGGVNAQRCARWQGHPGVRVALIGELFTASPERAVQAYASLDALLDRRG